MVKLEFNCSKCGKCCANIIIDAGVGKFGMFLLEREKHIFPTNRVFPMYGVGLKGKSRPRPEFIYSWQYAQERCMYFNEDNTCQIYEKRPLVCKAYPVQILGRGVTLDRNCPMICESVEEGELLKSEDVNGLNNEQNATKLILLSTLSIIKKAKLEVTWIYPIDKLKWTRIEFKEVEPIKKIETIKEKMEVKR